MSESMDEFGMMLIKEVRDRTIRISDKRLRGEMKDEDSQTLATQFMSLSDEAKDIIWKIVPMITDLSLHNMLCMFEENDGCKIIIEGEDIKEESDGLAGELYTSDGWIERYSNERIN